MNSISDFDFILFIIKGFIYFYDIFIMIFSTLEHILTHISFSIVSIIITIYLITFSVDEIIKLYDSSEKGIIMTFFFV